MAGKILLMNQSQSETNGLTEEWQSRIRATPIGTSFIVDNRSENEKSAQARLLIAQAVEKEQKNWRKKLSIGFSYFCYFGITLFVGFLFGCLFYFKYICE